MKHLTKAIGCIAALLAPQMLLAEAPEFQVQVLDTLVMANAEIDGHMVNELSGLAYDQQHGILYAVSDQGRLFSFALDLTGDKIAGLTPLSGFNLVNAEGGKMSDQGFNAEGITLNGDGTLTIISEEGPNIARFSLTGEWLADIDAPSALRDPTTLRGKNNGLESLTLHPTLGLLTAPEQPLIAEPRTTHTIHSATGATFSYDTTEIGETNVKGLQILPDSRLMILERMKVTEDKSLTPWLRLLDPASCASGQLCTTEVAKIEVPGISDANFEGLTQLEGDLFLIVSDDKIKKLHRSVFGLLRVTTGLVDEAVPE